MKRIYLTALLFAATTMRADAHTGHDDHGGFAHGFMHPIGGLDHVLAMVAIGVLAYQLGSRSVWLVPAAFVAMMGLGGMLGYMETGLPFVETGIALSVVVLGLLLAAQVKLPAAIAMAVAGVFAVFHGYAHGAELPDGASQLTFAAGFALATAALHVCGIAVGAFLDAMPRQLSRVPGPALTAAGVLLLVGP